MKLFTEWNDNPLTKSILEKVLLIKETFLKQDLQYQNRKFLTCQHEALTRFNVFNWENEIYFPAELVNVALSLTKLLVKAKMRSCKATKILALFALLSFFVLSECYLSVVDPLTYRTVNNFADQCVKIRHLKGFLKNRKLWTKLKKVSFMIEPPVCSKNKLLCKPWKNRKRRNNWKERKNCMKYPLLWVMLF